MNKMKFKIKLLHLILFLWILIVALRFDFLIHIFEVLTIYIKLLFSNSNFAIKQFDFQLFDHFFSLILITLFPFIIYLSRKIRKFLNTRISALSVLLPVILVFTVFSPLIVTFNPDAHNTIRVTKLLPPFSSRILVEKRTNYKKNDEQETFVSSKKSLFSHNINTHSFFADSIQTGNSITVFQGTKQLNFEKDKIRPQLNRRFFLFGTDEYGRDIYSRIVYGTRLASLIGLGSVMVSLFLGMLFGIPAGMYGGLMDSVFSRFSEMFLAFPFLFLIILILALFGNSILVIILVLGLSGWMSLFKIIRGEIISLKNKDFIISAKLLGFSKTEIFIKEIFPLIISPIIVNIVLQFGNVIMAESALSYLGLGAGDQYSSWGAMISSGQYYLSRAWWMSFFPSLFLFLILLTANKFGKDLEKIFNPRVSS